MRTKTAAFVLVFMVLILCFSTAFADNLLNITMTDPVTHKTYDINYNNKELRVFDNGKLSGNTYIQDAHGFSMYDNTLYIYYSDFLNHQLFVYCFYFQKDSISSFVINEDAFYNENCYASDGERVYFVWGEDSNFMCVYENDNINKINLKSQITKLLMTNKDTLTIHTDDGIFTYKNGEIQNTSPTLLAPETTVYTTECNTENITPETSNGFYIALEGVTVSKIKKAFAKHEITNFTKADGSNINSGKLGTGATFALSTGEVITVVIYGELTGEGNVNSRDLKALLNHLSRKELLQGSFLISADLDSDGLITTKDLLMLSKMY